MQIKFLNYTLSKTFFTIIYYIIFKILPNKAKYLNNKYTIYTPCFICEFKKMCKCKN